MKTQKGYLDARGLELLEEVPLEGHGHLEQCYDRIAQTTRVLKHKQRHDKYSCHKQNRLENKTVNKTEAHCITLVKNLTLKQWSISLFNRSPSMGGFDSWGVEPHQVRDGWVLLAEALHLLQHVVEHRHHAPLILALRPDRPQGAVFLEAGRKETARQRE